jgi:hypothetical protein
LEDSLAVELEDSLAVELEEENWDVEKDVENWDVEKDVEMKSKCRDAYATKCRAAGAGPPTPSPSIMTADTGLKTHGSAGVEVIGPPAAWQFDFGDSFGDSFGGLTDEDTVTSMASKETLAWSSRGDKQELCSHRVQGDAQRKSLRLVEESKDFADAEIPIHLWNDHVKAPGVSKKRRDKALVGLRKLGFRWFRKFLLRDCSAYLASAYGADWERMPRR